MLARGKLFIPLGLFVVLGLFLFRGLQLDPTAVPSALIDRPLPQFSLPRLGHPELLLDRSAIIGEVALLNIWATWCISCRVEHAYLQSLAERGVAIFGLNLKDEDAKALEWLEQLGDPYRLTVVDHEGNLGLDLGVTGAPETFIVDAGGVIRYHHLGIVNERVWSELLQPIMEQLQREASL